MSSALRGLDPREGLELGLMKTGRTGPLVSHAAGRRQASLGTPIPKTSTVAPGPKAHSDLALRRSQGASAECHCRMWGSGKPLRFEH